MRRRLAEERTAGGGGNSLGWREMRAVLGWQGSLTSTGFVRSPATPCAAAPIRTNSIADSCKLTGSPLPASRARRAVAAARNCSYSSRLQPAKRGTRP